MSNSVTVSTKIPRELKEKMKKLNIKTSKLLRKAIEDEVRRREAKDLKKQIQDMKPTLDKVDIEEIVSGIREDRNTR